MSKCEEAGEVVELEPRARVGTRRRGDWRTGQCLRAKLKSSREEQKGFSNFWLGGGCFF